MVHTMMDDLPIGKIILAILLLVVLVAIIGGLVKYMLNLA